LIAIKETHLAVLSKVAFDALLKDQKDKEFDLKISFLYEFPLF